MMNRRRKSAELWIKRGLRLVFAVVISVLICQIPLDFIEGYTYDARVALKPSASTSKNIQTITIDSRTLRDLHKIQ